jgi:hypothetical protein
VSVKLPFDLGGAEWVPDQAEAEAAWSLYVELVTRVATQGLVDEQGSLREALNSLHALFGATRETLKKGGPTVGRARDSVGGIAVAVLNQGLRPFLTKWHPALQAWEAARPAGKAPIDHEREWQDMKQARAELRQLNAQLGEYAVALAAIAQA